MADCFVITGLEAGGSQAGTLQYLSDADNDVWADLGSWTAVSNTINIDGTTNTIEIDYGIFTPGTWYFRLADSVGRMISNIISLTINAQISGEDGMGITGEDGILITGE